MNARIGFLSVWIVIFVGLASAQTASPTPTVWTLAGEPQKSPQTAGDRELQSMSPLERQRILAANKNLKDVSLNRDSKGVYATYSPTLNEADICAISISPDDLKTHEAFLKSAKTGMVRLQSADVCPPNDMIVKVSAGCANNVTGKATAYSFRTGGYRSPMFADIFFKDGKLSASGVFTIGIFSDLGQPDIGQLSGTSDGVKQIIDFQPPDTEAEIARQYSILKRGVQIGNFIYGPDVPVNIGNTFVLRSVAYKGKILKGSKTNSINILAEDERKDVTVVFKIIRQMDDGSIVLLWKELGRAAPPNIILEAKNENVSPPKHEFTRSDRGRAIFDR